MSDAYSLSSIAALVETLSRIDEEELRELRERGTPVVRCPRPLPLVLNPSEPRDSRDDWCQRSGDPGFSETLHDVATVLQTGRASSSDLAAWRCAELRLEGRLASVVTQARRITNDGGTIFMVGVRHEDEDGGLREEWF